MKKERKRGLAAAYNKGAPLGAPCQTMAPVAACCSGERSRGPTETDFWTQAPMFGD